MLNGVFSLLEIAIFFLHSVQVECLKITQDRQFWNFSLEDQMLANHSESDLKFKAAMLFFMTVDTFSFSPIYIFRVRNAWQLLSKRGLFRKKRQIPFLKTVSPRAYRHHKAYN